MLVLIQVSASDVHRLPAMAAVIKHFGPNRGHQLLVCHDSAVPAADAEGFCRDMQGLFDSCKAVEVQTSRKGWPVGPNQMFRECAKAAEKEGLPWMNIELDVRPLCSGWVQKRWEEQELSGLPFGGALVPTRGWRPQRGGPSIPIELPPHLVGAGAIYPAKFASRSVKLATVDVTYVWSPEMEPYDIALRDETSHQALNSPLMQHNFKTQNYRREGDVIVCDNVPGNKQDHSKPIDPRAVMIHGCKDDSLDKLLLGDAVVVSAPAQTPIPAAPVVEVAKAPEPDAPRVIVPVMSFIMRRLSDLMTDGKGRRIKDAAVDLQVDFDLLNAEVAKPESPYMVAKLGWLKLKSVAA
jgi:hypothetical protein